MDRREDRMYGMATFFALLLAGAIFYLSKDLFGVFWSISVVFAVPAMLIPFAICSSILEKEQLKKSTYYEKYLQQKQK